MVFQCCFKGVLKVFQGCFKEVSRKSRVFQESFKGVSRKIEECVEGTLRIF